MIFIAFKNVFLLCIYYQVRKVALKLATVELKSDHQNGGQNLMPTKISINLVHHATARVISASDSWNELF
ncbi:hypothetical protein Glove_196g43 [Diversispora epigaea]|uniref:Uncharacterized protein n=1 Tax=Diversispora epigaea TaxID=1348612 RepID=A0A397ITX3_9GLOM|nr:hypothetical protein Glove_196g43 [Diversispora epigaea]